MSDSLSLKDLLQPISKDDPSGPSLRYENIYDDIREAMRSEDSNLPQGVWQRKLKQPDWKKAEKLCFDTLANKSKDLQIAAWLIECLIHNKETSDITQGFQAFHDLMVKFWDTIHPQIPEDGDIDFRLSPFIWINEKLSMHLNEIKINAKTEVGATIYTFNTWIELTRNHDLYQVEDRPEKPDVIDQLGSNDNPTILDLQTNIEKTPTTDSALLSERKLIATEPDTRRFKVTTALIARPRLPVEYTSLGMSQGMGPPISKENMNKQTKLSVTAKPHSNAKLIARRARNTACSTPPTMRIGRRPTVSSSGTETSSPESLATPTGMA